MGMITHNEVSLSPAVKIPFPNGIFRSFATGET